MRLDRFDTQTEPRCDLLIAVTKGDVLQNLAFASGKVAAVLSTQGFCLANVTSKHLLREARVEERIAASDGPDRVDQFARGALFQHLTACTGRDQLPQVAIVRVACQRQDPRGRKFASEPFGRFQAVEVGH